MANTKDKETTKAGKVGNYSEPGLHPNDEVDNAGHKMKFDRGDATEDKKDVIQEKSPNVKKNVEIPREYQEAGIHNSDELDSNGHKKKFDRAAPEESQPASNVQYQDAETERSEPNYVEKEAQEHKDRNLARVSNISEIEFLEHCLTKTASGGWTNHLDTDLQNRIDFLKTGKDNTDK